MATLLLPEHIARLAQLVSISEVVSAVETGFRAWGEHRGVNAPRRRIHTPSGVRVSAHQGAVPPLGVAGLMVHCELVNPRVERQVYESLGYPVTVLYDAETADLEGILVGELSVREVESGGAIALRTAATSAVGTHHLARKDGNRIGLLGSGRQARNHLVALRSLRPVEFVKVYSPTRENRERFAREMTERYAIPTVAVTSADEAVTDVDIVIAATSSNVPVFNGELLRPGMHVTSIVGSNIGLVEGGFIPEPRRELDDTTMGRCDVVVLASSVEQVRIDQQADLVGPISRNLLKWEDLHDLGELLAGQFPGRTDPRQITLFKNNAGQGVADVAVASCFLRKAREPGIGVTLSVHGSAQPVAYPVKEG